MALRRFGLLLLLPLAIFLISAQFVILNEAFYHKQFEKHGVYDNFPVPEEQLNEQVHKLVGFLNKENELELDILSEKEKQHLYDVQDLIHKYKIATWIIVALTLLMMLAARNAKIILQACVSTLIWSGLFLGLIAISFEKIFTLFHEVTFSNDLWQLDPQKDVLINIFPQEFFYELVAAIILRGLIIAAILGAIMAIYLAIKKIYKRQKEHLNTSKEEEVTWQK